jgi:hypothetical protein
VARQPHQEEIAAGLHRRSTTAPRKVRVRTPRVESGLGRAGRGDLERLRPDRDLDRVPRGERRRSRPSSARGPMRGRGRPSRAALATRPRTTLAWPTKRAANADRGRR